MTLKQSLALSAFQVAVRVPCRKLRLVDLYKRSYLDLIHERIGRLPVIEATRLLGIVTRSDLLKGHTDRLDATNRRERARRIGFAKRAES